MKWYEHGNISSIILRCVTVLIQTPNGQNTLIVQPIPSNSLRRIRRYASIIIVEHAQFITLP